MIAFPSKGRSDHNKDLKKASQDSEPPDFGAEEKISIISKLLELITKHEDHLKKSFAKELFKPVSETAKEISTTQDFLASSKDLMFIKPKNGVKPILGILPFDTPLLSFSKTFILSLALNRPLVIKPASFAKETTEELLKMLNSLTNHIGLVEIEGKEIPGMLDKEDYSLVYIGGWEKTVNELKQETSVPIIEEHHVSTIAVAKTNSDIDQVIGETIENAFAYNGQYCSSQKGLMIESEIYEQVIEKFKKRLDLFIAPFPPEQVKSTVTQQVDKSDEENVQTAISDSIAEGSEVIAGGAQSEEVFYPTVLTNMKPERKLVTDDFRAPYLWIQSFENHPDEFLSKIKKEKRIVIYGKHATVKSRLKATLGWEVFERDKTDAVLPCQGPNPFKWIKKTIEDM